MTKVREDLRALANGIDLALTAMHEGQQKEFLIVVVDYNNDSSVLLNTVGNITNPISLRMVGKHLIDMATAQVQQEPSIDPFEDLDVRGHA